MRTRHETLCLNGMYLLDQDFAKMLLALSAESTDLLMPVYVMAGAAFARPCREHNPDWNIPDGWRLATADELREWAEGENNVGT